jgi:hypothetical protein
MMVREARRYRRESRSARSWGGCAGMRARVRGDKAVEADGKAEELLAARGKCSLQRRAGQGSSARRREGGLGDWRERGRAQRRYSDRRRYTRARQQQTSEHGRQQTVADSSRGHDDDDDDDDNHHQYQHHQQTPTALRAAQSLPHNTAPFPFRHNTPAVSTRASPCHPRSNFAP